MRSTSRRQTYHEYDEPTLEKSNLLRLLGTYWWLVGGCTVKSGHSYYIPGTAADTHGALDPSKVGAQTRLSTHEAQLINQSPLLRNWVSWILCFTTFK